MAKALTEAKRKIVERLYHPLTVESLRIHCREATPERIAELKREERIHVVGLVATGGRPREVLCSRKVKIDCLDHELKLSEILLAWGYESKRGKDVDKKLLPDATILFDLHVEMDMGTEDYGKVEARMRTYVDTDSPVIVITTTKTRKREILKRCDFLGYQLRACTIVEALAAEVVLEDCDGRKYVLKKAEGKRGDCSETEESKSDDETELENEGEHD